MIPWENCVLWLGYPIQNGVWPDVSKYDNDGYITGAFWDGDSLSFDGIDDYVDCGNGASSNNNYTVEALFRTVDTSISQGVVHWGDEDLGKRRCMLLFTGGAGAVQYLYFSGYGGTSNISSGIAVNDGLWYHAVITMDSSYNVATYVNGVAGNIGTPVMAAYTNNNVVVGKTRVADEYFDGKIALVRVFDKVLSAPQVREAYEQCYRLI